MWREEQRKGGGWDGESDDARGTVTGMWWGKGGVLTEGSMSGWVRQGNGDGGAVR